jgi:hypothetical protein
MCGAHYQKDIRKKWDQEGGDMRNQVREELIVGERCYALIALCVSGAACQAWHI